MAEIEVSDLACTVGGQRLFAGANLRVERGRGVRIAGPSGCGKSTLLKCVMGFVAPSSGVICIDGQELTAATVWTLRRHLAYLAQEPDLGQGRVLDRLREPFGYRHNAERRLEETTLKHWMDYFHLPQELLHKDLKTLSGGEKQRLAVVLAILLGRTTFFCWMNRSRRWMQPDASGLCRCSPNTSTGQRYSSRTTRRWPNWPTGRLT